jgi:hypothetical protein
MLADLLERIVSRRFVLVVVHGNINPVFGELECDRSTDTLRTSADQRVFSLSPRKLPSSTPLGEGDQVHLQ